MLRLIVLIKISEILLITMGLSTSTRVVIPLLKRLHYLVELRFITLAEEYDRLQALDATSVVITHKTTGESGQALCSADIWLVKKREESLAMSNA